MTENRQWFISLIPATYRYLLLLLLCLGAINTARAAITVVGSQQASISNEITYVGTGVAATATGGNVTPGLPAGVAVNDILICVVEVRDNTSPSMTGWNLLSSASSGTTHTASLFWRRATGADPATVTHTGAEGIGAQIMAFRGVDTTTAFDVANSFTVSASDTTVEAAAISTVTANTMLVFTQHMAENFSSVANPTGSAPWTNAFLTEYDAKGNNDDLTISAHYGMRSATGSQPAVQAAFSPTSGRSGVSHGGQLALRPAGKQTVLSINVPAGTVSGDVLVAAIAIKPATVTITPPAGWTSVNRVDQTAGDGNSQEIFYHVATASEPAAYSWTFSAPPVSAAGGIISYRGVDTTAPVDVFGGNVTPSGTAHTAVGVTTTLANDMVISSHSFSSSATWTPPAGMTEEVDIASLTPSRDEGISLEINDVLQAGAGATGDKTATASGNADTGVAQIVALRAAVSTPVLVADWRMNETSWNGTAGEVLDYTGRGLNGISVNGANTDYPNPAIGGSPGTCRYGYFVAASDQYVQVNDDPLLDISNELTVTAWINPSSLPAGDVMTILSKSGNYTVSIKPSGVISWSWNNSSSTTRSFDSTATINTSDTSGPYSNGWHHIAIVYSHSEQTIYIDGNAETNSSPYLNEDLQTGSAALLIGGYPASPGRAFNGQIDEVRIYGNKAMSAAEVATVMNETHMCPIDKPQHYAVSFPNGNTGSSCNQPVVKVTAHDSSHRVLNVPVGTTMDFSTSTGLGVWQPTLVSGTGTWSPSGADDGLASYTWPGGESSMEVKLSHSTTTPPGVNINLTDGYAADPGNGGAEDPYLQFSLDPIIRVSTDGSSLSSINTQVAGKGSNQAPGQTLYIQLKQSGVTVGGRDGCEVPGEYSGTASVTVALECINPASCSGQQISVNGTAVNSLYDKGTVPAPLVGSGVNFTFDGSSGTDITTDNKAPLVFNFADAGQVKLHFAVTMDPSGPTSLTPSTTFTGTSNTFVSRPFGYSLESSDPNLHASSAGGTAFKKAGEPFSITLRAVDWDSADDANQDGFPDAGANLANNAVTPNFGNEDTHVTAAVTQSLVLPASASADPGTLTGGTVIDGFNSNGSDGDINNTDLNPGQTTAALSYDEVGIIDLNALTSSYLGVSGADIQGTLTDVGRFIPDRFSVTDNSPSLADDCAAGAAPFTYMDQNFYFATPPVLTITALNTGGQVTKNYGGNFWKLNSNLSSRSYSDQTGSTDHGFAGSALSAVTLSGDTNYDGTGTLATAGGSNGDTFRYQRSIPEAPFPADINLDISAADLTEPSPPDGDGVCYDPNDDGTCDSYTIAHIGGANLKFGRLVIGKEVSSEVMTMNVPLSAEYYDGSGYVVNTDDECTGLASTDLILSNPYQTGVTNGSIQVCEAGGTTSMTVDHDPLLAGQAMLTFSPPGTACQGFTDIDVDLSSLGLDYLLFDWQDADSLGNGPYTDNPTGRATFGILSRPKDIIYTREPWK